MKTRPSRLRVPMVLAVATVATGALAFEACEACPPLEACEMRYQPTDGGVLVTANYADGAVTDGRCPPVPDHCPVA